MTSNGVMICHEYYLFLFETNVSFSMGVHQYFMHNLCIHKRIYGKLLNRLKTKTGIAPSVL